MALNALLDVSAAIDSVDCDFPGCDREAERDGRCRWHVGRVPHLSADAIKPGALAHLMHDDPEPVKETPVITCKIDGCDNRPLDQRGPYAGLCAGHKRERQEQRAQERAIASAAAPKSDTATTSPPPAAPAAAEPPATFKPAPSDTQRLDDRKPAEAPPGRLTALAQAVDQAQEDLDAAIARHSDALEALREALEAA